MKFIIISIGNFKIMLISSEIILVFNFLVNEKLNLALIGPVEDGKFLERILKL